MTARRGVFYASHRPRTRHARTADDWDNPIDVDAIDDTHDDPPDDWEPR